MAVSIDYPYEKLTSHEINNILEIIEINDKVDQRRAIESLLIKTKTRFKNRLIRNIEKFK